MTQFKNSDRSDVLEAVAQLHRMEEIHLRDRLLNALTDGQGMRQFAPPTTTCEIDEITARELIDVLEPLADEEIQGQTYPYHPLNKVLKDCYQAVNENGR